MGRHMLLLMGTPILILGIVAALLLPTQEANATPSYSIGKLVTGGIFTTTPNLITVDLSKECLTLLKHNETSNCPTYQKIYKFDNSNQVISGKFVTINGFFQRLPTNTVEHWAMYPPNKLIVMIDADYRAIV